ncbi:hypothetical protein OIU77_002550 [Salix suchowensis]|uniref:Uncharacterized protein n=1 Tax=Salix suchowensis TaxID=1278906 RepID=A0ABQ9AWM0_9ROSI|nr:hypothetical protein OIU77_002550 [Salix suchowensis]
MGVLITTALLCHYSIETGLSGAKQVGQVLKLGFVGLHDGYALELDDKIVMSSKEGGASTKGGRGKPKASKSVSRSQQAGLQFPVGKIARLLISLKFLCKVAFEEARKYEGKVVLGDRPVHVAFEEARKYEGKVVLGDRPVHKPRKEGFFLNPKKNGKQQIEKSLGKKKRERSQFLQC